jgi:hypothetical protein
MIIPPVRADDRAELVKHCLEDLPDAHPKVMEGDAIGGRDEVRAHRDMRSGRFTLGVRDRDRQVVRESSIATLSQQLY